jgi:hypothetical protein
MRKRKLYSDKELETFSGRNPICLNGISEFAESLDLLDRSIHVIMPGIMPEDRKEQRVIDEQMERARPMLLGAFYDLLSNGLANSTVLVNSKDLLRRVLGWAGAAAAGIPRSPCASGRCATPRYAAARG